MKLPIGIDGFEKIRTNDFYYADKTLFIKEVLQNWGEVNLFTRPRRFGKTLNMSMLKSFFEAGGDPTLFDGMILSRLVDTFISRISLTMLPVPNPHNTVCVLSWEEARHWQSRSSGYSSS